MSRLFPSDTGIAASIILTLSFMLIAGAWAFQMAGYTPCPLCLQQRWAYYFAIPAAIITLFLVARGQTKFAIGLVALICLAYLYNTYLGVYHAGAEWKFWPGPDTCGTDAGIADKASDIFKKLKNIKVIRCDEAAWRFLGISLAGYNAIFSAFMALVAAIGIYQQGRNKDDTVA